MPPGLITEIFSDSKFIFFSLLVRMLLLPKLGTWIPIHPGSQRKCDFQLLTITRRIRHNRHLCRRNYQLLAMAELSAQLQLQQYQQRPT